MISLLVVVVSLVVQSVRCDQVINSDLGLSVSPLISAIAFNITDYCSPAGIAFQMASSISNIEGIESQSCITPSLTPPTQDWTRTINCASTACTFAFTGAISTSTRIPYGGIPVYFIASTSGQLMISVQAIVAQLNLIHLQNGLNDTVIDQLVAWRMKQFQSSSE